MNESALLASVLLLYLLLGKEAVRPIFLVFLFLVCLLLTGPGWIALSKVVLVISSFCLLVLSRHRGSVLFLLLVTLSSLLLVCSVNWLSIYLALELQALALFVLAALNRSSAWSTEAGLKYFSLGALSSALFLLGCVLFYGVTGEGSISTVGGDLGKVFITIALLFKLSAAPFHMWAPDVYEGAPTPTAAVFAVLPKVSVFSILVQVQPAFHLVLVCSFFSIVIGALGALNQTRFKRLMAYSGISHLGFVLFAFSLGSFSGLQASLVYLLVYIVMSLCLFPAFLFSSRPRREFIWGLSAVSRENPGVALVLALVFLSTAGIPPLAGFLGKWLVLLSGLSSGYFQVALGAVVFSVVAGFYYVRLVQLIYFPVDFFVLLWQRVIQRATSGLILSLLVGATFYLVVFTLALPSLLLQFGFLASLIPS